jgi:small-conductance mechanosensitive channel
MTAEERATQQPCEAPAGTAAGTAPADKAPADKAPADEAPADTAAGKAPADAAAGELEQRPEICEALEQAGAAPAQPAPPVEPVQLAWLAGYAVAFLVAAALHQLLRLEKLPVPQRYEPLAQRLAFGAMAIVLVLGLARATDTFLIRRLRQPTTRFNLRRLVTLLAGIVIFFIVLSILSATWYTALVSLGLISLVLGFALQTPITSFIGWVYILVRTPYRVGDRVRIGDATGDVIDVSYLDTTLWEFGGEYLSTDHPSGRIIKFPNASVLTTPVFNYSWPLFPYIWNEIRFQVAYNSDLDFVARTMQEVAESEIGPRMAEHVAAYRTLLAKTPVNELEVRERPSVFFRVSDNTWIEATVRYLVEPRQAGRVKNRLVLEMLKRLQKSPERVLFPKADMR